MRFSSVRIVAAASLLAASGQVGCGGDSTIIEVRADDLAIPTELSAFCLAVADSDAAGGEFARLYQFDAELTGLPQTLTVDPGEARSATASVRGYRSGVEISRDQAALGFDGGDGVALSLSRCPAGAAASPTVAGTAPSAQTTRVAASFGRGGTIIVGVGMLATARWRAGSSGLELVAGGLPTPPGAAPSLLLSFDADGDCDDDLLVGSEGEGAQLWLRGPEGAFESSSDAFSSGAPTARAAAAADVDGDGDIDLVIGDATSLVLLRNDGGGRFSPTPGSLATDATSDITALAFGDVDADGDADLVVARGREAPAPVRLLLGQVDGQLVQVDAAAPAVALSVVDIAMRDFDGDRIDDVALAVTGESLRVFGGRGDGRLEDRTFLYFPDGAPMDATAVAVADWNGDCLADILVGSASGLESFRGSDVGFASEAVPGGGGSLTSFADLDDDGDFDALLLGAGTLTWLRR